MSGLTHLANATGTTSSLVATTGADCPTGSLIVVVTHDVNTVAGTVTDEVGNTYHVAATVDYAGSGSIGIFYAYNCIHLPSGNTVTYTPVGSQTCGLDVSYATGMKTTSAVLDGVASSTSASSVSLTPSFADDLFVGISAQRDSGSPTQSSGFSTPPDAMYADFDISGSLVASDGTSKTWAPGGITGAVGAILAAFVASGAAPNTPVTMNFAGIALLANCIDVTGEPAAVTFYTF